jgi:CRISPR-associated endonuclease Csn1
MDAERARPGLWLLGLDAGTDSIGWSVFRLKDETLVPTRLLSGGVRLFDWGREPQTKFSLNRERGLKRRARRRIRAKTWRRDKLIKLLVDAGITPPNNPPNNVWELRARATREPIGKSDLAACLLHMARHRGFKSTKLAKQDLKTDKEAKDEIDRWSTTEKILREEMRAEGVDTISQLFAKRIAKAKIAKRDPVLRARRGVGDVPTRLLVGEDLAAIREAQGDGAGLSKEQWDAIEDLIFNQRPITPPPPGRCSAFPEREARMATAMPSAQRFLTRQTLCNLRVDAGDFSAPRPLSEQEFDALAAILDGGGTHTWAQLRAAIKLPRGHKFTVERERKPGAKKSASRETDGDETAALLDPLIPGWKVRDLTSQDAIVARLIKDRRNRRALLAFAADLGLNTETAEKLADAAQFGLPRGTLAYGSTTVERILPHMKAGTPAHIAIEKGIGRSHSDRGQPKVLPALPYYGAVLPHRVLGGTGNPKDDDEKRYGRLGNVTVHIALNEIRKIVNKLIRRYGSNPRLIVVETTRELKANTEQLRKIINEQKDREDANKKADDDAAAGDQKSYAAARKLLSRRERLRRFRFAKRQQNLCPYTGKEINRADLWTEAYHVDHVIPLSRGGTDADENCVVCEAGANTEKLDKTPWEAWHHQPDKWKMVEDAADRLPETMRWRFGADAAERAATEDEGWAPRQIRDTAYIARVAREYLLHAAPEVAATKGSLTGYLRAAWDLPKNKHDQRRHFVDAAVIAVTDRRVMQFLNTFHARFGRLPRPSECPIEPPYPHFQAEVMRLYDRIWPSIRPDHSLRKPSGALHNENPLGATEIESDGEKKVRLASRVAPEGLFMNKGKFVAEDKARKAIELFASERFRERFRRLAEKHRAADSAAPYAEICLRTAKDTHWGPRGIGEIRCWCDNKEYDPKKLFRVPRGNHRAVIDTNSNAWLDIRPNGSEWKGDVIPTFQAMNEAKNGSNPKKGNGAIARLRRRDVVAWEQNGQREIGWIKVIVTDGRFFVWPLRVSETMEAAATRSDLKISTRDGIYFKTNSFREAKGRPVTINILGRLRDPGPLPETGPAPKRTRRQS